MGCWYRVGKRTVHYPNIKFEEVRAGKMGAKQELALRTSKAE